MPHIHSSYNLPVPKPKGYKRRAWIARAFFAPFKALFMLNYYIGNAIILAAGMLLRSAYAQWVETKLHLRIRRRLAASANFKFALGCFLLLVALSVLALQSAYLAAAGLQLKDRVMQFATRGSEHLFEAKQSMSDKDITGARNEFTAALKNFKESKQELDSAGSLANALFSVLPQKKGGENLIEAGQHMALAGTEIIEFYHTAEQVKFTPQGLAFSGDSGQILDSLTVTLSLVVKNIDAANEKVSSIQESVLPEQRRTEFSDLKGKLAVLSKTADNFSQLFTLGTGLIRGNKNILFVFENNNELRAGGGFIGTFGAVNLQNGQIERMHISSIYDLDGQLEEKIAPPEPVLNVNDRWYLRDSNWFADFPKTARKISSFYEKEGGETPDVVIAMTPTVVVNTLKVTGPIEMPSYNVTLDSDNFVEQVQALTTMSSTQPLNTPKQLLADFFPVLIQKITALPPDQFALFVENLQLSLNEKQAVVYSRDPQAESLLEAFNWSGSMKDTDRDFLSIVSSNLGGTKTDLFISQQVSLDSTLLPNGQIQNHVTITRTNRLPQMKDTENTSFVRIYVPAGSVLVDNSGFDRKDLVQPPGDYMTDPDVQAWEKNAVRDVTTGTLIGKESGKTFFGNWLTLEGGQSRTIQLTYLLPYTLGSVDHASLLVEKQIGAVNYPFSYAFHFPGKRLEWTNAADAQVSSDSISVTGEIAGNHFYGFVLTSRQ